MHGGIAASDAICCFELKAHSKGDDHRQALAQISKVKGGASLAKALADLLHLKTKAGYGAKPLPDTDVKRAGRAAGKLVQAARERRLGQPARVAGQDLDELAVRGLVRGAVDDAGPEAERSARAPRRTVDAPGLPDRLEGAGGDRRARLGRAGASPRLRRAPVATEGTRTAGRVARHPPRRADHPLRDERRPGRASAARSATVAVAARASSTETTTTRCSATRCR